MKDDWNSADFAEIIRKMKGRREIAKIIRPLGVGVELGVADGFYSEQILHYSSVCHLYSIDMYAGDRNHDVEQYKRSLKRLSRFRNRNSILRMRFDEALSLFDDESLDFVYVDGYAHNGEEGGRTFHEWWPKVRSGGLIAGHDYSISAFPEVVYNVDAFSRAVGKELYIIEEKEKDIWNMGYPSWLIFK